MPVEKLQRKLFEASARGIIARLEPIEFLGLVLHCLTNLVARWKMSNKFFDQASGFLELNRERIAAAGLQLTVSEQKGIKPSLDVRVFFLTWPKAAGADLEIRVSREIGSAVVIVSSHTESGGFFDDKPGMFSLDAYLDAHGRIEQKQAMYSLPHDEQLDVFLEFVLNLIEGEWKDIIEGKRWEFIRDPMINDYF